MSNWQKWTVALLAVFMIFSIGLSQPAYAVDDGEEIVIVSAPVLPDRDYDGIPDTFDAAPDSNLFTGKCVKESRFSNIRSAHYGNNFMRHNILQSP